ncbi:hypothetical protein MHK_009622 [Candidatus Magnetomorum sp. HK-1]|nr:hypothetical protein MHK_009622 [Candidatus Magnetomorum sp. HK-1]
MKKNRKKKLKRKLSKKGTVARKKTALHKSKQFKLEEAFKDKNHLINYQISYDPIELDAYKDIVPEDIKEEMGFVLYPMCSNEPKKVIKRLLELINIYPAYPKTYNYLAIAYAKMGRYKKSKEITYETYQRFPEYLFAKVNFASICLENSEFEKIPIILENKFDLKLLYPDRDVFHVVEATAFFGLVGRYFVATEKIRRAQNILKFMESIDSECHITKILKKEIKQKLLVSSIKKKILREF